MKILAVEKECQGKTEKDFQPLLKDEAKRVWELQQSGALREIYFHRDLHTSVIILECADLEEAYQLLATLPLVTAELIEFELIPLAPYDGLARLFAQAS